MFERIGIIGGGGWGTALALLLADHGKPVFQWTRNEQVADEINARHTNPYLAGIPLPSNLQATTSLASAAGADLLVIVVPSKAMRQIASELAAIGMPDGIPIVSCTKGIEHDTGLLMSGIVAELLPQARLAVLSGPNLAPEVARRIPAASVIGSSHPELLDPLQHFFSVKGFRAYTSDDVTGIQLGGALKNIFAIAAGVCDGFGMGDNAKAALVTRSLAEMTRLGMALGGRKETFFGLSGVGDLMVTCFSRHSRNRQFGERIGKGETPTAVLESLNTVAEGVPTSKAARQCIRRLGIEAPITEEIFSVLHEGKPPRESISCLLGRPPKSENDQQNAKRG